MGNAAAKSEHCLTSGSPNLSEFAMDANEVWLLAVQLPINPAWPQEGGTASLVNHPTHLNPS
jgi:hypothetical protein